MNNKVVEHEIIKRVYQGIKRGVVSHEFQSGQRLNIEEIAEQLRVSTTPVREILNRLVAEGLIDLVPRVGFFMKHLWEAEVRDLYELNQLLMSWSVSVLEKNKRGSGGHGGIVPNMVSNIDKLSRPDSPNAECLVKITNDLFVQLAAQSGNSEVNIRVRNVNDRLHYIRLSEVEFCERENVYSPAKELLCICQLCESRCYKDLRQALDTYHKLRLSLIQSMMTVIKISSQEANEDFGT